MIPTNHMSTVRQTSQTLRASAFMYFVIDAPETLKAIIVNTPTMLNVNSKAVSEIEVK
jgi:hypothetical protein